MAQKNILLLDSLKGPWASFLSEYFEDTAARVHVCDQASQACAALDRPGADLAFINPSFLTATLIQKLKFKRNTESSFRVFGLKESGPDPLQWDDVFSGGMALSQFQKQLVQRLEMPPGLRLLIVDDEPEIGQMFRDFLEHRAAPAFEVDYTADGFEAVKWLENKKYDAAILDVKMPVRDGRDIYRDIRRKKIAVPVIVFFDAISGDEISDLYQIGRPAIVEKGAGQSGMPEMMSLIKKMVYFG